MKLPRRVRGVRSVNLLLVLCCALAAMLGRADGAQAQGQFHGIAFAKGCQGSTSIGAPLSCAAQILNVVDQGHDTVQVTGLIDVVNSAGGAVSSGNILGSLQLVFSSPTITCVGGSGAGTAASPYVGATSCLLPFNTLITTNSFSHYTVQPADFALPSHHLTDSATLNWNNTCTAPGVQNCTTGAQTASAGSSTAVQKLQSSATTDVRNAQGQVVTAVAVGSTVHDFVTVAGQPGQPNPSGKVNVDWFLNGTCSGTPAANSGSVGPLVPDGGGPPPTSTFDATGFSFTVNTAGLRAFRAHYEGDATYLPSDGPCEPLQVVDANIQISPQHAANPVGTNHTLTGHVNVDDGLGGGPVNAPDGTVITFAKVSGPGSFVGGSSCTTSGGTGSCTVVITSAATGTTVVNATTDVAVAGVTLHRSTGDGHAGDSPNASKTWTGAAISIAPSATNEVGHAHTFTVTVTQDVGNGTFVAAPGANVTVTCTAGNGATPTPPGPFTGTTNAAGQFTLTVNSTTAGTDTCHAAATLSVGGSASFTVETNGVAPNSGDATKTWVDANIQITPQNAMNQIGRNHTLTGHVNVNDGSGGGFTNAPDGTVITFTIASGPGGFVGPSSCTTSGGTGSCTVEITSTVTGMTKVHAATAVSVGGVSLMRATGDALAGDSPDAQKTWVNARISITPSATNAVGQPHTFTVTLERDPGTGTFVPAAGEHVDVTLTDSNGATHTTPTGTCTNAGANTNAAGQCTITFTSPTAGKVTGHATATLTVNGVSIMLATDGAAPNSGDAVKTFVDANVQITPQTATNPVGTNHTLTGHVNVNDGSGGFVNAPDGTVIAFTIPSGPGAFVGPSSCTTSGGTGSCTVVISSDIAGTTTIHATTTVTVGGVSLTRATGDSAGGDSGDATKVFVAGSLRWFKDDNAGNPLGGATFQVCRTADVFGNAVTGECVAVTDNQTPDADPAAGVFALTGLKLGHYTVQETSAPPGFAPDPSIRTADLGTAADPTQNTNATIATHFVNGRPIVKIAEFGYTNVARGTPTAGVVTGTATFTADLKNYGDAAATLSGSLTVSTDSVGGTLTCTPSSVTIGGILAAGAGLATPITVSCDYTNLDDGAKVTATLNVDYTLNGLTRAASGSPAVITFTVQSD